MAGLERAPIHHWINPLPRIDLRLFVQKHTGLSTDAVKELEDLGALYINGERAPERAQLRFGDYVRAHTRPRRFPVKQVDWKARVVGETEDFLVVDKPSGIPIHATVDNSTENALVQMIRALGTPLFITQRLDRPTSGLFVLAKNTSFQRRYNISLAEREVRKTYLALTEAPLPVGRLTHYMAPGLRSPRTVQIEDKEGWFRCELEVLRSSPCDLYFESQLALLTGRTHQIRAQSAACGAPVVGDALYGSPHIYDEERIELHSATLAFSYRLRDHEFQSPAPWSRK